MNKQTRISIKIILLFNTAILMSIVPDIFPDFFNDYLCSGATMDLETKEYRYFYHYGSKHMDLVTHWGYRHYLYFFMGLSLAIVQIVEIITIIGEEKK